MSSATLQITVKANYDFLDDGSPTELGNRVLQRLRSLITTGGALNDQVSMCDEHEISIVINANQYSEIISQYVQQSLLGGDLRPERIAALIATYGLMSPSEFIETIEDQFGAIQDK
jgi:hypothetical protein